MHVEWHRQVDYYPHTTGWPSGETLLPVQPHMFSPGDDAAVTGSNVASAEGDITSVTYRAFTNKECSYEFANQIVPTLLPTDTCFVGSL